MISSRLTRILLAGTIVPSLALVSLVPASAQAPDPRDRQMPRPHPEGGGDRGARGPGGIQGQAVRPPGARAGNMERREGPQAAPVTRGVAGDERRGAQPRPAGQASEGQVHAGQAHAGQAHGMETAHDRKTARPDATALPERAQNREGRPDREDRATREDRTNRKNQLDRNSQRAATPVPNDRSRADGRPLGDPQRAGVPSPDTRRRADDRDTNRRALSGQDGLRPGGPVPSAGIRAGERIPGGNRLPGDPDAARRNDEPGTPRRVGGDNRNDRRIGPTGVAIGIGAGLTGGFLAATGARRLDDLRRDRREVHEGDSTFIREPGRTIVQERGRAFIVHDENDRFRALGLDVRRERHGNEIVDTVDRPGGVEIITYTDVAGRLLRRIRRTRDGQEFVLIDNGGGGHIQRFADDVIVLPPPQLRIPRDRYIVDYRDASVDLLYDTLIAPPLVAPPRRYTLDQIRYSPDVRSYLRSIDIDTINFDTGSWDVPASATGQLQALATAIKRAVERNPNAVFLVEGFTDATGNPDDNLSLSDRRAQSVAEILSKDFGVPPENLTTQGYGEQDLKEQTQGPSAANRRVVVQNITQLLAAGEQPPAGQ